MTSFLLPWRAIGRRLILFLATILAMAVLALGANAQVDSRDVVVSDAADSSLNLRAGPGLEHRLLRSLDNGARMLAGEQRGEWFFLYRMDGSPLGWGPRAHLAGG